jgi:ATP-dependent DNA helicase RecG
VLSAEELKVLLADLESDRVERTTSTSATDKFAQAVCAFANDMPNHRQPGYLLIGANNDGTPVDLKVSDQLLQNLGGLRSDGNIQPLPALSVGRISLPEGEIAIVEVQPSDLPPVRYAGQVWIRVGPRKAIASEQDERILSERRVSSARSFDARPCLDASVADLALGMFDAYRREVVAHEIIAANRRSTEEQLGSLRFLDPKSGCPTMAGIVLFGKNPRYFLPGAYLQFLKLPATVLTDLPTDQAEIAGDLLSVLRELDTRLRANLPSTLAPVSALREQRVSDYPEWALRELLMNAVMHRSYESNTPVRFYWFADRIEIQSPGGLYPEVTPETISRRTSYRNPVIAEAMKALGYVNRFGAGIQRAQALLAENGNPPAEFVFEDPHAVLVIVRKRGQ